MMCNSSRQRAPVPAALPPARVATAAGRGRRLRRQSCEAPRLRGAAGALDAEAFLQPDMQAAVLVFELFETMRGHEVEQLFELLDVHARHGRAAELLTFSCFVLGPFIGRQSSRSPRGALVRTSVPSGMNRDFVFDANSAHAFHVDSGFEGHDVPRANLLFLPPADPRALVNLDPQAVARAVHEILSQADADRAPAAPPDPRSRRSPLREERPAPPAGPAPPPYTSCRTSAGARPR